MTTPRHELITWHPASEPPATNRDVFVLLSDGAVSESYYSHIWNGWNADGIAHWAELPTGPSAEADAIVARAKMADELAEALAWLEVTAGCPSMEGDPNRVYVRKLLGRYKEAK